MIAIRNLSRRYGVTRALHDVSLDIGRGEVVGLLGHNGAGKTTMMKLLTGFLEPSAGTIHVGGIDVAEDREAAQRRIGYLPENAPTYPEMLVQDYLAMVAELRGVPTQERRNAVIDAASATDLLERLISPIHTLSKGYRQRVGLAQAIVHRPDVLILDEPTNGLDPTQIRAIRSLITQLRGKTTVLLSTHILQEIEAVCDRVVVLIGGVLAADAALSDLLTSDKLLVSVKGSATAPMWTSLDGVQAAQHTGADEGRANYQRWELRCAAAMPVDAVVDFARDKGWSLASVAPDARTLERVFKDLELEHMARQEVAA